MGGKGGFLAHSYLFILEDTNKVSQTTVIG